MRRLLRSSFFGGIVCVTPLIVGCHDRAEPSPEPERPNVVVIIVDTLRADRLPFYGCPVNTAPFLSELAGRSMLFENAWSPSSWTLPATVSALTSVHPFQHGVNDLEGLELGPDEVPAPVNCIPADVETLAEVMRAAGYRTYGVVSNILVGAGIGLDRGFDEFVQLPDEDADAVNACVEDWQDELLDGAPFFLYLHYFDPHDPLHARKPWFDVERSKPGWPEDLDLDGPNAKENFEWLLTRLDPGPEGLEGQGLQEFTPDEVGRFLPWIKAAYDSEIGFVDSRIEQIYDSLGLEDAVVVFFADHGEEFFEHGGLTHGQNLYTETARVPLILSIPGDGAPSGRVGAHVSTLDIVPTLRSVLGLPPSEQDEGRDLLAESVEEPILGMLAGRSGQHEMDEDIRSIVVGEHRLLVTTDGPVELYDIVRDPAERDDLAGKNSALVAKLLKELERRQDAAMKYEHATQMPPPPNEALLEHLKGIGYLGDDD